MYLQCTGLEHWPLPPVTVAEMVARRGGPISHKLRSGETEDRRWSQTTEGTGRLSDGDEGDSDKSDSDSED